MLPTRTACPALERHCRLWSAQERTLSLLRMMGDLRQIGDGDLRVMPRVDVVGDGLDPGRLTLLRLEG